MKTIEELYGIHQEDIWVIGSGSSLDHVSPSFFDNKYTVGVNRIYKFFTVDYLVIHHHHLAEAILASKSKLIVSEYESCIMEGRRITERLNGEDDYYMYRHQPQGFMEVDYSVYGKKDMLIVGGTTVINAMSFAVHLGAANIILCGVDGGKLDGKINIDGYYDKQTVNNEQQIGHVLRTRQLIQQFRDFIKTKGINVYTLNPFTNMGYEGHQFKAEA